jgi:hypothetical protein
LASLSTPTATNAYKFFANYSKMEQALGKGEYKTGERKDWELALCLEYTFYDMGNFMPDNRNKNLGS